MTEPSIAGSRGPTGPGEPGGPEGPEGPGGPTSGEAFSQQLRQMNDALLMASVRQHELIRLAEDANTAFLQRLHDLSDKYDHELTSEQHSAVFAYMEQITPVVEQNAARSVVAQAAKQGMISGPGGAVDIAPAGDKVDPAMRGDPVAEAAKTATLTK